MIFLEYEGPDKKMCTYFEYCHTFGPFWNLGAKLCLNDFTCKPYFVVLKNKYIFVWFVFFFINILHMTHIYLQRIQGFF